MVTWRTRDAHPRSKKDAGQDDDNSRDSRGDSFPIRLVLVRHDRLGFSSLRAVTCEPLDNHGCLRFCELSRTSHISISPPTAFPLVHLDLQSMFCLHDPLSSLIGSASGRSGGYETGYGAKLSDFGCWLEPICDYAFYLFLLVGMTIGQWRSSGTRTYLVYGGLLLFGALASFLALGWERRRLASGRPEQLLKIWQGHAESRPSNPFLYFGRRLEFIVRRCFFPYALLFFALFNLMNVAFVLSVIGANLVWPIALYSSHAFAGGRSSAPRIPEASARPRTSMRQYAPVQS